MKKILMPIIYLVAWGLVFWLFLFGFKYLYHDPPESPNKTLVNSVELLQLINQYRTFNGIDVIQRNESFCEYAILRSNEVSTDWSHGGYFQETEYGGKVYTEVCPECEYTGENLARDIYTNQEIMMAWEHSPTHNDNLLDARWDIGCVGITWKNSLVYVAFEAGDID